MDKSIDLREKTKQTLFLKGRHSCEVVNDILLDLALLAKPNSTRLNRTNDILPFEDVNSLEFLCQKNDCSMFVEGSHSKKRPNNLIVGRLYDGHVLDMYEFGAEQYTRIDDFKGPKKGIGSKPILVFNGDQWENDSLYSSIQNMLLDLFRGEKAEKISMSGLDHIISCTIVDSKISIRTYTIGLQKTETKVPNLVLSPMGPFLDLTLRRHQKASEDMWKTACKKAPSSIIPNKVKNISRSDMGDKFGRIHMQRQDLKKLNEGKKIKAIRNISKKRSSGDITEKVSSVKRVKAEA
eukprot:gene6875-9416_t